MSNAVFADDDINLEEEIEKSQDAVPGEAEKEPEPEKEPEQQAEPAESEETQEEEKEEEQKESPRVPLAELQAERKRRQEFQRQVEEQQETYKRLEERLAEMAKKLEPQEPEVSFEDNPAEYLRQQQKRTGQTIEELREQVTQSHQLTEQQQKTAQLHNQLVASESAFRQEAPDYDDAASFLREGRAKEYRALGYTDPVQVQQMLQNEAYQLVEQAAAQGMEPARMVYEIAKARGYQGKPPTDKLERVEKGQQRNKSLSSVGGEEERPVDLEALANMSDAEFDEAMVNGQWEKLFS